MTRAVKEMHNNSKHLCACHTLITALITSTPAQARTRAAFGRESQTLT
jgi:hypothetical protein